MNFLILEANPFIDAYKDSDLLGRLIFIALAVLSIISWSVLLHTWWLIRRVKKESFQFKRSFHEQRLSPLSVQYTYESKSECPNAFYILYEILKNRTCEILEKKQEKNSQLHHSDLKMLESQAATAITSLTKYLDKNLYMLSTIVTLAPFLGLLGTVYGILTAFSNMNLSGSSSSLVLNSLSLALTTTVIGLVDAIPALIGYNYLKNTISDFDIEMERFATDVLTTIEIHHRN